jgi:transcriptional regulator with XRE-family HTH domain
MNKFLKLKIIEKFGSQAEFSMVVKEDESTISRVLRGRRKLRPDDRKKWAKVLGCLPEDIFSYDENNNPKQTLLMRSDGG